MTDKSLPDPHPFSEIRRAIPLRIPAGRALMQGRKVANTDLVAMYDQGGTLENFINLSGPDFEPFREGPHEPEHMWAHRQADAGAGRGYRGICYFIGGEEGPIKIGHTVDIKVRLGTLRLSSPLWLEVLASRSGGAGREAAYHQQFAAHRLHGEWFTRHPDILAEIDRLNQSLAPDPATGSRAAHNRIGGDHG